MIHRRRNPERGKREYRIHLYTTNWTAAEAQSMEDWQLENFLNKQTKEDFNIRNIKALGEGKALIIMYRVIEEKPEATDEH